MAISGRTPPSASMCSSLSEAHGQDVVETALELVPLLARARADVQMVVLTPTANSRVLALFAPVVPRDNDAGSRDDSELWGPEQVAAFLGVEKSWVYVEAQRGRLPGYKVGRLWRFRPRDIRALLDEWKRYS